MKDNRLQIGYRTNRPEIINLFSVLTLICVILFASFTVKTEASSTSISLSTSSVTITSPSSYTVTVSHVYGKSCHYTYETSGNNNYASLSWGSWNQNGTACPLTITGVAAGRFNLRVKLVDAVSSSVVATTGWITVTVNSSVKSSAGTPGVSTVRNGWYMLESGNSGDRVLDINNWNMNNGGNLELYKKNNTTNQRFYLQYLNNGYYSIRTLHSGRYLHVANENNKESNVHQWEGGNHENAQWALKSAGNGYYYLQSRSNGSYLDNSNGSTGLGNNVRTYPFNGTNAQKWKLLTTSNTNDEIRTLSDGWYEVQCGNNNSYVWAISGASGQNDANLIIQKRNGSNNQKFYVRYLNNGFYAIMAGHSNKYLHKQNGGQTDNVVQYTGYSTEAIHTQWTIINAGNGYYFVRSKAGNFADNMSGSVSDGNRVWTYVYNASAAQMWKFVPTSAPQTQSVISVTGISLNKSNVTLQEGKQITLSATVMPSNATNRRLIWSSSNSAVASVDSSGRVTAKKFGSARVTVKSTDGGKSVSCVVKVEPKSTKAEKLAQKAESQIGVYGTKKNGKGRGDYQKYGKWYGNNGVYWCAQFVAWCGNKVGVSKSILPKQQSTLNMGSNSNSYVTWRSKGDKTLQNMKRGDVIFFSKNQYLSSGGKKRVHHVGIITKVNPKRNQIEVVEGNTGNDIVARRTYSVNPSSGRITASLGNAWNGEYFCGYISIH